MSTPSIRSTNIDNSNFKVDVKYDAFGYVLTISKEINGKTYCVTIPVSDYIYKWDPNAMADGIKRGIVVLNQKAEETMIKEFNNPSFRRKDYDRKKQTIPSS